MYDECVVAIYDDAKQAESAVHALRDTGFPIDQVSLVTQHLEEHPEIEEELKYGDDSIHDSFIGAGLGGIAGMLVGVSLATVAGAGVILFAGPLAGLAAGAVVGSFLGEMAGWGVHESQIRHYEKLVNDGHALVVAEGDPREVAEAHRILGETKFRKLQVHAKTADDSPEIFDVG